MKESVVIPFRLAVLTALGLAAMTAGAQPAGGPPMVNARVLSVQPMMQQVPVSNCGPYGGQPSGAGAAVGAVTGGLVGSQLGRGNGNIAGAILGAVGGAFLGNSVEASQSGCAPYYAQRVTGYDVVYEYGGRQYRTRMAQAPGRWLQIPSPDGYYGGQPGYDSPGDAQNDPPPPGYPAAGAVVTAPPQAAYNGGYPPPPQGYPPPAYPQPAYAPPQAYPYPPPPYPYPPAPRYVYPPVGVNLSFGGMVSRHLGLGFGVGF